MFSHPPILWLRSLGCLLLLLLLTHCTQRRVDVDQEIRDPAAGNASLIQVNPLVPAAVHDLLQEADALREAGDLAEAILTIQRGLSIVPGSSLVQQHLAEAYLADGQYQQAMYWSTLVVNQGPDQGTLCERSRRTQALAAELLQEVAIQAQALESIASCSTQRPNRF
ncbi:tetratricopeptide repeat protein [Marinicella meishanensis]|uniref:tetratricopeptide repeat protein n=1 Tax=Marinicella meishanensis TaxID=2873263 RepID=UPI001CBFB742|nr:tetratricopeptide repeat protein [Marinicella sp. NBU2979]